MRFQILALSLIAVVGLSAADSYAGTYKWSNKKPNEYAGKTLNMTLAKVDEGWQADFTADFNWPGKAPKPHTYSGVLIGDPATGLTGKVYDKGQKRYWTVDLKLADGKGTGTAAEPQSSKWKSKGTFEVDKQ